MYQHAMTEEKKYAKRGVHLDATTDKALDALVPLRGTKSRAIAGIVSAVLGTADEYETSAVVSQLDQVAPGWRDRLLTAAPPRPTEGSTVVELRALRRELDELREELRSSRSH